MRILLADDHGIVRAGIRALLEREGWEVVAEADDGDQVMALARLHRPDVVVVDLAMPRLDGIACATHLLADDPHTPIVLLSAYRDDHHVVAALRAGVRGYVVKTQAAGELVQAVREVKSGAIFLSPSVSKVLVNLYVSGPTHALTPRLQEVLRLLASGRTNREIGAALGVTEKTAELYRARIMAKLNIHDTAGLVRYAVKSGLIEI